MQSTDASRVKFVRSTVDETLFGERTKAVKEPIRVPEFEPPWVDNGKTKPKIPSKPLLFYCPTSSPRPASSRSQSTPLRRYKPVQFSPTYVDETLFGSRRTKRSDSPPPTAEFNPPWVKKNEKKQDRPILFDCNSRLVFNSSSCDDLDGSSMFSRSTTPQSRRSSSRISSRAQSVGNMPKSNSKPPWR